LHKAGLRYRLDAGAQLAGRPDIAFRKARVAVFVDGCFWHGCKVHGTWPRANAAFWAEKISRNRERDGHVDSTLRSQGWYVVRVWEHQIRSDLSGAVQKIKALVERAVL
jgi:DNA mismatch endonuclease (patch repair protein)